MLTEGHSDQHSATGKVSGTPEPPMPLNGAAITLQATLAELCEISIAIIAGSLNIEARKRQRRRGYPPKDLPVIEQARNIVPQHIDTMIDADAVHARRWDAGGTKRATRTVTGIEVALQVWLTHQKILNLTGVTRKRTRLAMPCPVLDCGRKTLGIDDGETDVSCSSCGGRWSDREYQWLSNLLIEDVTTKQEKALLNWLLAEAQWKVAQVRKLTKLDRQELESIESWAIIKILQEIVD